MRFECIMIGRVPVEVDIPDGEYYNHNTLDDAVKKKYGAKLGEMLLERSHMEHFRRLKDESSE